MPGNGHCFFSCVIHQLLGLTPDDLSFENHVMQLRLQVVDFLKDHIYQEPGFMDSLYIKDQEKGIVNFYYEKTTM